MGALKGALEPRLQDLLCVHPGAAEPPHDRQPMMALGAQGIPYGVRGRRLFAGDLHASY
jgi:hypothetical protein